MLYEKFYQKRLRLTDKNLEVTGVSHETIQNQRHLVIEASLSPSPYVCTTCNSSAKDAHGKPIIVKSGKKRVLVRFDPFNHMPMVMRLAKHVTPVKIVKPTG
ncbi:hypothetical protein RV11_GL001830 [Enterococcus phoeniculicola]|jgi:transposase|uniref:Transposase IS204/IS1001/IS1096/IS1165 zinc-finger domain-containing protein n=1 Tax=Enterococcus phoeniculicola ATCC BAA-412 TaxID=1158610 RepID=R3TSG1_9ENTE|nr:hypothetical protein UC3_01713 [Enterococcus phoeniculicola ATCC BAA-412]EOT75185.1 hypothetical protein I589_02785 [Enterococcus phoeniculicola ATCC BAA-412]OJG69927.1 hypothetical protein RV11_GL001830 [Enterococcus phoeniculicola]